MEEIDEKFEDIKGNLVQLQHTQTMANPAVNQLFIMISDLQDIIHNEMAVVNPVSAKRIKCPHCGNEISFDIVINP